MLRKINGWRGGGRGGECGDHRTACRNRFCLVSSAIARLSGFAENAFISHHARVGTADSIQVLEETVWKSHSISERYCGILQMIL